MQSCIERELREEIHSGVENIRYLFVEENFFLFDGRVMHALDHFFEAMLERRDVQPTREGMQYTWVRVNQLAGINLRPMLVRDHIFDGTYGQFTHFVQDGTTSQT